jgi:hypothetical protein
MKGHSFHCYPVHLPISICTSARMKAEGITHSMSTSAVSFSLSEPVPARLGEPISFLVRLPRVITGDNQMLVRARGKVVDIKRRHRAGVERLTVTATMDGYDFMAKTSEDEISILDRSVEKGSQ